MFGFGANSPTSSSSPSGGGSGASDQVPANPQQSILQARNCIGRGEYYAAITATDTGLNLSPNIIEKERMHQLRAEAYLTLKQFNKAEKEARLCITSSDSLSPQGQYLLGCSLLGQFKITEAVDAFDVAEALMRSPQAWKYVVLPEDDVLLPSNNGASSGAAGAAAAAAGGSNKNKNNALSLQQQQQIQSQKNPGQAAIAGVPRRYRDIGIDKLILVPMSERASFSSSSSPARAATAPPPSSSRSSPQSSRSPQQTQQQQQQQQHGRQGATAGTKPGHTTTKREEEDPVIPLLPPPRVTYEWQASLSSWKADANLARKLDEAHSTRLLPPNGLLSGIRMLEQVAKQSSSSSRFLIVTLRNDTDYDLVYQFHACGSEDSEQYRDASSPPPPSNTQFLIRFPHVIPPSMIGVAIIFCDSWRAKMLTLAATVTFAMQKTSAQLRAEKEAREARFPTPPADELPEDGSNVVLGSRMTKTHHHQHYHGSNAARAQQLPPTLRLATTTTSSSRGTTPRSALVAEAAAQQSPHIKFAFSISGVIGTDVTATTSVTQLPPSPTSVGAASSSSTGGGSGGGGGAGGGGSGATATAQAAMNRGGGTLPPSNAKGGAAAAAASAGNFAIFSFDHNAFCSFASERLPFGLYSRSATMGGGVLSQTQSDVTQIPVAYLTVLQKPGGLNTAHGVTSRLSPVLVGVIAQYMAPRPLRLASCISTTWRNVVSSFPPTRFDDYPYGVTFPDYLLARDIKCSPFTVRNEPVDSAAMSPISRAEQKQQISHQQHQHQHQQQPHSTYWTCKREDNMMYRTIVFRNVRGDAMLYAVGDHGRGNDYMMRLPGGVQGRCLLCRVTSTQGFLSSDRTAEVKWANPSAAAPEYDLSTRLVAKISHAVVGGNTIISLNPVALEQLSGGGGGENSNSNSKSASSLALALKGGFELVNPTAAATQQQQQQQRQPVIIRDVASKHVLARVDSDFASKGVAQSQLKFLAATDALWCAVLLCEYLVAW